MSELWLRSVVSLLCAAPGTCCVHINSVVRLSACFDWDRAGGTQLAKGLTCCLCFVLVCVQGTTGYPAASGSSASTGYNTRGQYNPYANTAAAGTQPAAAGAGAATGGAAATTSYDDAAAAAYGQYKDSTGYGQYQQQQYGQYQQGYGQYPQQGYGQQYGQGR